MQSFSRGWSFLKQAWSMAFKDKDLIKPSIYALLVGSIVFTVFLFSTMVASVITTYTTTAYHTCLYLWACNVEVAQTAGEPLRVTAPAPLAAVLGAY